MNLQLCEEFCGLLFKIIYNTQQPKKWSDEGVMPNVLDCDIIVLVTKEYSTFPKLEDWSLIIRYRLSKV